MHFDPEKAEAILVSIRAGAYPQVAAEAAGVHRKDFLDWVARGENPKARSRAKFRTFAAKVREAMASARLQVELDVREKDPRFWLKHGPGREKPDYPGWAGEVKSSDSDPDALPAIDGPEWNRICHLILTALSPFPEARLALADVMKAMTDKSSEK
jgi:hypothetical protein